MKMVPVGNTEGDEDSQDTINYRLQYKELKRKLKFLLYENECFQETLRTTQRKLLKVNRDRSFLLDRLLNYEKVEITSSEGEDTESSDDEIGRPDAKRRKLIETASSSYNISTSGPSKPSVSSKKKKVTQPKSVTKCQSTPQLQQLTTLGTSDGHMTPEEVERHLEARQQRYLGMDHHNVSTIPSEMFGNEPPLDIDSESNELCEMETSPSNLGEDCLSVDMIAD